MRCSFKFIWYDLWVGAYWDAPRRILFVCPLPCCVFRLEFKSYAATVLALKPVAYWRLGEIDGTIAHDETGSHDGTYAPPIDPSVPTSAEINALPERWRKFICDLETLCDPAGMVQEIGALKDQVAQLTASRRKAMNEKLEEADQRIKQRIEALESLTPGEGNSRAALIELDLVRRSVRSLKLPAPLPTALPTITTPWKVEPEKEGPDGKE